MLSSLSLYIIGVLSMPICLFVMSLSINAKSKNAYRGFIFINLIFVSYMIAAFVGLYFFYQIQWPTIELKFGDWPTMQLPNGEMIHPDYMAYYLFSLMAFVLLPGIIPVLGIYFYRNQIIKKFGI